MSGIHTEVVSPEHEYTRSECPWIIEQPESAYWRLIHYISGGGMSTFGRTVRQEEARLRQRRFLVVFSVLAVIWLALLVF